MPLDVNQPAAIFKRMTGFSETVLSKARLVPIVLQYGYQALIKTVVFAMAVVLIVATAKAVFGTHIVIEPISVPKKLEEDGYTGPVISRRLLEEVRSISRSGNVLHLAKTSAQPRERVNFRSEDDFASLTTIQLPSSGVTLRSMSLMLRDFLGIPEQRITGEIIIKRAAKPSEVNGDDAREADSYAIIVRFGPPSNPLAKANNAEDIDEAIRQSAPSIAEIFDPVGLAAYYFDRRDWSKMGQIADGLIARTDPGLRKEGLYLRGLQALDFERYDDAIPYFVRAVVEDAGFADAYNSWGAALAGQRKYADAIAQYNKAIDLNPLDHKIFFNRAVAFEASRDYDRAIADYSQVIKLDRRNVAAFNNRGVVWRAKGDIDRALVDYDRAIEIDSGFYYSHANRASALCAKGQLDQAVAAINRAIQINPRYSTAYNNRGFCYAENRQYDLALKDFDKALDLDPLNAVALNNRCYYRALAGQPQLSIEDCDQALKLDPTDSNIHDSRGYVNFRLGAYDKAIADFDAALKIDPNKANYLFERGVAKRRRGDNAAGDADIAAAKQIKPGIAAEMAKIGMQP